MAVSILGRFIFTDRQEERMSKEEQKIGSVVVLGAQYGDEGKGKTVDALCQALEPGDLCIRSNGGANAGHTICFEEEEDGVTKTRKVVTHLLPSAIMHEGVLNLVGPAVACDLDEMHKELEIARRHGARVLVDRSAPVVLPHHKMLDRLREQSAGTGKIGTTQRGIGPVFGAMTARLAVRMGDLVNADRVRASLLERKYAEEMGALIRMYDGEPPSVDETVDWCMGFSAGVRPLLADVRQIVAEAQRDGRALVFEGAQGIMLDVLHGSQPDTTSSTCTLAGVGASLGVYQFDHVIGVAKAYATRVGNGPFPTELDNEIGERLRTLGGEFGATTGRPRRCGWLDLPALLYACRVGGIREIVLTKADVLSGFEEVCIATEYHFDGAPIGFGTLTSRVMRESEVVYQSFLGWDADAFRAARTHEELPREFKTYLAYVVDALRSVGVRVSAIGTGPGRADIINL